MLKSELIEQLALRYTQFTTKDIEFAVKTILDSMIDALRNKNRIEIRGVGSFAVVYRPPRVGRSPLSGEKVIVPEKRLPYFRAGKELRERVDKPAIGPARRGQGKSAMSR